MFVADQVLAKHDENYMPPEVADALKRRASGSTCQDEHAGQHVAAEPCPDAGYAMTRTELGHFALVLALAVALVQATLPLVGAAPRRCPPGWTLADAAALAQFAAGRASPSAA